MAGTNPTATANAASGPPTGYDRGAAQEGVSGEDNDDDSFDLSVASGNSSGNYDSPPSSAHRKKLSVTSANKNSSASGGGASTDLSVSSSPIVTHGKGTVTVVGSSSSARGALPQPTSSVMIRLVPKNAAAFRAPDAVTSDSSRKEREIVPPTASGSSLTSSSGASSTPSHTSSSSTAQFTVNSNTTAAAASAATGLGAPKGISFPSFSSGTNSIPSAASTSSSLFHDATSRNHHTNHSEKSTPAATTLPATATATVPTVGQEIKTEKPERFTVNDLRSLKPAKIPF